MSDTRTTRLLEACRAMLDERHIEHAAKHVTYVDRQRFEALAAAVEAFDAEPLTICFTRDGDGYIASLGDTGLDVYGESAEAAAKQLIHVYYELQRPLVIEDDEEEPTQ